MGRPTLRRHPKFARLARLVGGRCIARGALEHIWEVAYQSGNPYIGDAMDVEAAAEWDGREGILAIALRDAGGPGRPGFLDVVGADPERYAVHDLTDHEPEYVRRRRAREQGRVVSDRSVTGQHPISDRSMGATRTPAPAPAPAPARTPTREKQKRSADAVSPAAPARRTDRLIALWQERYGQKPTWGKGDYVQLARLDKALGEVEVDRRFAAYLESDQEFYAGHPLKLFCSQADRFAVPTNGTVTNKRGRQAGGDQPRECHDARPDGPWAWLEPARDVSHAQTMLGMAEDAATRLGRLYGPVGWYYDCAWEAVKHWRAEVARLTPAEVR